MFSVGALDAYFCDAYSDIIAAAMLCKARESAVKLPRYLDDLKVPVSMILERRPKRDNWKWRMAARSLMEKQNILSLDSVSTYFNKFCREGHHLFGDVMDSWATGPSATKRMFGINPATYRSTVGRNRNDQRKKAREALKARFDDVIFQRRHDCIHCCDRPKVAPQKINSPGTVANVIRDIEFLVSRFDNHIQTEVSEFLRKLGFSGATIAQVGY